MNHPCFQIPEVVRFICDKLDARSAYSMALVAKRFLEPALDVRWRELTSFVPIVRCLPDDVWKLEAAPDNAVANMIVLQRNIVAADLQRYLNCYAGRIRSISPHFRRGMTFVSSQVLHALQVATDYRAGALSPLLEDFNWDPLAPNELRLNFRSTSELQAISNISPCMLMFIGANLKRIDDTQLKELTIGLGVRAGAAAFMRDYLHASSWAHLEALAVNSYAGENAAYIPPPTIRILGTLPRLKKLLLHDFEDVVPIPFDPLNPLFLTLDSLELSAEKLSVTTAFLQYLPPNNALSKLSIAADVATDGDTLQQALDAIGNHCSPLALQALYLADDIGRRGEEELELDEQGRLDITSLLAFKRLNQLSLSATGFAQLTPNLATLLPSAWPNLEMLTLESTFPSSQIPLINHSHFLALLQGLPRLIRLTLRFDVTRVTGHEVVPGAPFRLKSLDVSDSPISSPSRVLAFLKANTSLARAPWTHSSPDWKTPVHLERWRAVQSSW